MRGSIERFRGARLFAVGGRRILRVTLLLAFRNGGPGTFAFERTLEGRPFGWGAGWSAGGDWFPPTRSGRDRLRGGRTHTIASEAMAVGAVTAAAVVVGPVTAEVGEGSTPALCPLALKEAA